MLLTINEAAKKCAISYTQLKRLIDAGELPVVSLGQSRKGDRIEESDLKHFIKRRKLNRGEVCQSLRSQTKVVPITRSGSKSVSDELAKLFGGAKRKPEK